MKRCKCFAFLLVVITHTVSGWYWDKSDGDSSGEHGAHDPRYYHHSGPDWHHHHDHHHNHGDYHNHHGYHSHHPYHHHYPHYPQHPQQPEYIPYPPYPPGAEAFPQGPPQKAPQEPTQGSSLGFPQGPPQESPLGIPQGPPQESPLGIPQGTSLTKPGTVTVDTQFPTQSTSSIIGTTPPSTFPIVETEQDEIDIRVPVTEAEETGSMQSDSVQQCMRRCPVTSEFNPVCGTNNVTYNNPSRYECAKACGIDTELSHPGSCRQAAANVPFIPSSATFTPSSPPPIDGLPIEDNSGLLDIFPPFIQEIDFNPIRPTLDASSALNNSTSDSGNIGSDSLVNLPIDPLPQVGLENIFTNTPGELKEEARAEPDVELNEEASDEPNEKPSSEPSDIISDEPSGDPSENTSDVPSDERAK